MNYSLIETGRLDKIEGMLNHLIAGQSHHVTSIAKIEKETLTVREAAAMLGWSRSKLSKELQSRTIRSHKPGGRIVILKSELIEDLKKY